MNEEIKQLQDDFAVACQSARRANAWLGQINKRSKSGVSEIERTEASEAAADAVDHKQMIEKALRDATHSAAVKSDAI